MKSPNKKISIDLPGTLTKILQELSSEGYFGLLVGGIVRDSLIGSSSKDWDVEVYGITSERLSEVLENYGTVLQVGKAFGVIKLKDEEGYDYDFSLPRRDSKPIDNKSDEQGRGIEVTIDSNMTPQEAAKRRDYSINALAYNPLTHELYDYYNGVEDIQNKILRATDFETFTDDPLRVLRGMQFAARFGMKVESKTAELCKSIKNEPLQNDRVRDEWMKFFTKCTEPSKGLQFLIDTEWIENYPELHGIVGLQQEYRHHPEGSVEIHTGFTMDAASRIVDEKDLNEDDKVILIASALCHDLGKVSTTEVIDGEITSYDHHIESGKLATSFLKSVGITSKIIKIVRSLVEEHMCAVFFDEESKKSTILHLAERLNNATIEQLEMVILSDMRGRPPKSTQMSDKALRIFELAKEKGVYKGKATALLQGADVLTILPTLQPGPVVGEILQRVRDIQLKDGIHTKKEAISYANKLLRNKYAFLKGADVIEVTKGVSGPLIGQILEESWNAQLLGEFQTREEALIWLRKEK